MEGFKDIIKSVQKDIPKAVYLHNYWYVLKDKPAYSIRFSKPDPFDNYQDIVAKVSLFYKDTVLYTVLITRTTDVDKFKLKLLTKIQEHYKTHKEV